MFNVQTRLVFELVLKKHQKITQINKREPVSTDTNNVRRKKNKKIYKNDEENKTQNRYRRKFSLLFFFFFHQNNIDKRRSRICSITLRPVGKRKREKYNWKENGNKNSVFAITRIKTGWLVFSFY